MTTFDFVRPSGVWSNEMVPGASDYYGWDWRQARILNGDLGGSWAPLNPIIIGGAGMQLGSSGSVLSGGVTTRLGGRIQLGPWDLIQLSPPRTVTRMVDMLCFHPQTVAFFGTPLPAPSFSTTGASYLVAPDAYLLRVEPVPGKIAGGLIAGLVSAIFPISFTIPSEFLINGATDPGPLGTPVLQNGAQLASVTLNFRFLSRPSVLPTNLLRLSAASGVSLTQPPTGAYSVPGGLNVWSAAHVYSVGQYMIPATQRSTPLSYFRCITHGTSAHTEPVWNTTPGATTIDGFSQWVCIGPTGDLYTTKLETYYNNGNPQSITAAFDTTLAQSLDFGNNFLQVTLANVPNDGTLMLHSLQFTFNGITQMLWS